MSGSGCGQRLAFVLVRAVVTGRHLDHARARRTGRVRHAVVAAHADGEFLGEQFGKLGRAESGGPARRASAGGVVACLVHAGGGDDVDACLLGDAGQPGGVAAHSRRGPLHEGLAAGRREVLCHGRCGGPPAERPAGDHRGLEQQVVMGVGHPQLAEW
ncbi:hypothetical protein GCM10017786_10860 [Amycolatopsis deserti]|uniref:Uncharacterized protein n=1 Tax=Amycolatopsis deserti TaxID=185696 RepID=A0ABQ3II50_9PSEU|nr:hypothetical protein [Amycolatopsis deserti]GHE82019.1 hypothetical protein GCM10017786_10860 [Amycolatopsis deserti]